MKGRNSLIVKAGRIFQQISPFFSVLDKILGLPIYLKSKSDFPAVFILAPPRSGSTLTYQVLASSFKNYHLTNLWNLLYATPAFGAILTKLMCSKKKSEFKSIQGFVPGLCGEAEGLKFWSFWSGTTIDKHNCLFDHYKAEKLFKKLQKICSNEDAFIGGYLGHVFVIDALDKIFSNSLFIHLKRDLLSNAYSIYKLAPDSWFSVKTKSYYKCDRLNRYEQIAGQVLDVHQEIVSSNASRVLEISYEDLCDIPHRIIDEIQIFSDKNDMKLSFKQLDIVPAFFQKNIIKPDKDKHASFLYEALIKDYDTRSDSVKFALKNQINLY